MKMKKETNNNSHALNKKKIQRLNTFTIGA